jgi:hypothetical protein
MQRSLAIFQAAILSLSAFGVAQSQPPAQAPLPEHTREVRMFAQDANGNISEVAREVASCDRDISVAPGRRKPTNRVVIGRLPQPKAKLRFKQGEPVALLTWMPSKVMPNDLELLLYRVVGEQRVTDLAPEGGRFRRPAADSITFKVFNAGVERWKLAPAKQLDPGEYCFSPLFNNDNFCFGVDAR